MILGLILLFKLNLKEIAAQKGRQAAVMKPLYWLKVGFY